MGRGLDGGLPTRKKEISLKWREQNLVDVSDLFFCSGEGKEECEAPKRGRSVFFFENRSQGGGLQQRGGEGPGGRLWRIGEFG